MLFCDIGGGRRLPFAALARTKGNRLILWPPVNALEPVEFADGHTFPIHHATLELSNGETHFTCLDGNGQRIHDERRWKLAAVNGGLNLWLIGAYQVALLEKQVGVLEEKVKTPTADSKRREAEYRRYVAQMARVLVTTPPLRGDFIVSVVHLLPGDSSFRGPVKPTHFPMGSFWNTWVDGWPDGDNFQFASTGVNVGGVNLLLLTASPPGRLKSACFLGGAGSPSEIT